MLNYETLTTNEIKEFIYSLNMENFKDDDEILGFCMKYFKGSVNPLIIREIIKEIKEERNNLKNEIWWYKTKNYWFL